jgi:hypothetical protein
MSAHGFLPKDGGSAAELWRTSLEAADLQVKQAARRAPGPQPSIAPPIEVWLLLQHISSQDSR